MADPRSSLYRRLLASLLAEGVLEPSMSVLVSCGGSADRDALAAGGFTNVTITNLAAAGEDGPLAPFVWERQDAENLTYADGSFDIAIVSAGLHHCHSPHRALLELYRVARVAAIALESRDSSLMRLAIRLGAADAYELGAVAARGLQAGGVGNTSTPNYIYRWTEREVEKTVASFAPHARHRVRFFREFELTDSQITSHTGARARVRRLARPLVTGITHIVPNQANLLAFVVEKPRLPDDLQPWMRLKDGELLPDPKTIGCRYDVS